MKKIVFIANERDKVLNLVSKNIPEISFAYANKLLRQKDIRVNNVKQSENINVEYGNEIAVFVPDEVLEKGQIKTEIV